MTADGSGPVGWLPSLGLPPPADPDLLLAIATVLGSMAILGLVSGWSERRLSAASAFALLVAVALGGWVWEADRAGWSWERVPEAFVEMVARAIR
ncbi:MAG: hypothetical protein AAF390_16425 [Pseudomonadota bacterium]